MSGSRPDDSANVINEKLQRMLNTAVAFFLAGERCDKEMSFQPNDRNICGSPEPVGDYAEHVLGAPTVASYAMAVELIIKIMLDIENNKKNTKIHRIMHLFFKLSRNTKCEIFDYYANKNHGIRLFYRNMFPVYGDIIYNKSGKQPESHLTVTRYNYEYEIVFYETDFLRELFIACRKSLLHRLPGFVSVFEKRGKVILP